MAPPNAQRVLVEQGGSIAAPTLLGQGPARIPTGGKLKPPQTGKPHVA